MKGTSSNPLVTLGAAVRSVCLLTAALALAACHHSTNTSSYTVGGTITGLGSGSVVLIYNGSTTLTISASTATQTPTWTFPGTFPANSSYVVTVETQPPGELCEVTGGGTGTTLTTDVTDVTVVCSDYGQWTWEGGLSTANSSGLYGTQNAAAASNAPGARYDSSSWTDSSGNLWLFGGYGYNATGNLGSLNDLWRYSPSTGLWTWISGGTGDNASGVYGTLGTAAATNAPGARYSASSWIDATGNLWLFGGYGYDATGVAGYLNDLWEFNPGTGLWTWVSGGNGDNASGIYGTLATAAATNAPGARYSANTWFDASGNMWLFGGIGYASTGGVAYLNDLWRYSPTSGQWTWVGGAEVGNASGVYGTQSTPAAGDVPGARQAASSWIDSAGTLWLFGGYGYDSAGNLENLNDLWRYLPNAGLWIWIDGGSVGNASGVYGTQGSVSASTVPGARSAASSWTDSSGNFWLFGGSGYDSTGGVGDLYDLWQYNPGIGGWTWVSGGNSVNANGAYGIQGNSSATTTEPGARLGASAWFDSSGSLWLFGGVGYGSSDNGYLNDLWQFVPP
jgi:N-acetylneuraminic acid mutarotase